MAHVDLKYAMATDNLTIYMPLDIGSREPSNISALFWNFQQQVLTFLFISFDRG